MLISRSAFQRRRPVRFGQYIIEARKAKLMSQKELAARINKEDGGPISPQYLNDIEHDRRNPPQPYILDQLADVLDLERDALYALAGQIPADIETSDIPPERLLDAMKAFRRELGRRK
jgi:transcriptional regulator with XRE-family HTH domain